MGKCWKCGSEITLKEEETRCDNCEEIVRYWCNTCKNPFDIEDKKHKKLHQCKWCGYFKCPICSSCSLACESKQHKEKMILILRENSSLNIIAKKIVDYFEEIKLGKQHKNCPFGVPLSYAKGKIKGAIARMEGYRTNSFIDQSKFKERITKILNIELGKELTLSKTREAGSYGLEYRDIFNYAVCARELKPIKKKTKEGIEYVSYKRIEEEPCPYLDIKNLLVNQCFKCKKKFPKEAMYCNLCKYVKKTKYHSKNEPYELKLKLSNKDICQLNRSKFKKEDENKII